MPLYEYKCIGCDASEEYMLSINHKKPTCIKCGLEMIRVVSRTTFSLKGTGWCRDGYRKGKGGDGSTLMASIEESKVDLEQTKKNLLEIANKQETI